MGSGSISGFNECACICTEEENQEELGNTYCDASMPEIIYKSDERCSQAADYSLALSEADPVAFEVYGFVEMSTGDADTVDDADIKLALGHLESQLDFPGASNCP